MVLERNRVDYVNGPTNGLRQWPKEYAIYCLVRVFEGMKDDFGVGEVVELKAWAGHAVESSS